MGKFSPELKHVKKLSNIFGVSLDYLVDNNIKDILIERTSNSENLAGLILKFLRVIGILFVVFLIIDIIAFLLFIFFKKQQVVVFLIMII